MPDTFENFSAGLNSPAFDAFVVSPDDNVALPHVTRAIYVGGGGDLTITMAHGQTVTFTAVQPGMMYPLRCSAVLLTGTTASGIVGLY